MSTFVEFINNSSSEKVVLSTAEASKRLFTFSLVSGTIYKRSVDHVVSRVKWNDTDLAEGSSTAVAVGGFFFDSTNKELYINNGSDPSTEFISVTYKFFFSTRPVILPHDLDSGYDVEWEGRINSIGNPKSELDNEDQTGIALDGQGTINLINKDGFFEPLYDKLFWENKEVRLWMWSPELDSVTESQLIFEGLINNKRYNENFVSFGISDFISRLRDAIPLTLFSASDGDIDDSIIGRAKRRIYGEVNGLQVTSIDNVLEGYSIAGTFSGALDSQILTGTGSTLIGSVYQGDTVVIETELETLEIEVATVDSNTQITLASELEQSIINLPIKIRPPQGARQKNRTHIIAGHALKTPQTTITEVLQANRFKVASTQDLEAGDFVEINGERKRIRRLVFNEIVLDTNLSSLPSVSDNVTKQPVQDCFAGSTNLLFQTDYTVNNLTSGARLIIDNLAEVNRTPAKIGSATITMTNGSTVVSGTSTVFKTEVRPRDYIKIDGDATYYEVLNVNSDTSIDLVTTFTGTTNTTTWKRKNVEFIADGTPVSVRALGITDDGTATGEWMKTASQAVKHLLVEAGLTNRLDNAVFAEAETDMPYKLSLAIPTSISGSEPTIRSAVNLINQSVFGSLTYDKDFVIRYQTLHSEKPTTTQSVSDDDIISWSVNSDGKNMVRRVVVNYQHFDRAPYLDEPGAKVIEEESQFIDRLIGIKREEVRDAYLFDQQDAQIIAERLRFFREVSNAVIVINSKVNFYQNNLNDVIRFEFDRLFERSSTSDKIKIGLINFLERSETGSKIEINDLAAFFNRIGNITEDTANEYDSATALEKSFNGYITDDQGLISGDEETYNINLIG